jgi:hypothetical protein
VNRDVGPVELGSQARAAVIGSSRCCALGDEWLINARQEVPEWRQSEPFSASPARIA